MQITKIVQQHKQQSRYSIFVDEKYSFSLSEQALLDSQLVSGQELTKEQAQEYKQKSAEDKLYNRTLCWVAMRPRSVWETEDYLRRHDSPAPQTEQITNKLIQLGMLDDKKYAEALIHDAALLRPTSVRKMIAKLRQKHVPEEVIQITIQEQSPDDLTALRELVAKKRQLTKYKNDDQKLMQFLARQGFNYSDIKRAFEE